jgi:tetratricopeptide (TPR) repeat protein
MLRGVAIGLRGNMQEGLIDLENALKVFEEGYFPIDLAYALTQAANFYASQFELEKALKMIIRSVTLLEDLTDFRGLTEACFIAGNIFFNCKLSQEALDSYEQAIKTGEIVRDYNTIAWAYVYSGVLLESIGKFDEAITKTIKGKELAEKTDAFYIQSMAYTNLAIQYSRKNDLPHAKEFFEKFMRFSLEIDRIGSKVAKGAVVRAKAVYFTASGQFDDVNHLFEESIELHKSAMYSKLYESIARTEYAWSLQKQEKKQEAETQKQQVEKLDAELRQIIEQFDVESDLMVPKNVKKDEEFTLRLDVVNISSKPKHLVQIDGLSPTEFTVIKSPTFWGPNGLTEMKVIKGFTVLPIQVSFKATETGVFNLNPRIIYQNENGKNKVCMPKQTKITVKPSLNQLVKKEAFVALPMAEFEFKTEAAKKAFNFLVGAFVEDYMRRKLPLEWSGWRTLMEIVKHGKISKRMVYGSGGYRGRAISELEHRGIVEARIFPGERGRGGRILKLRVFHDKETVKRLIDEKVMAG